MISLCIIAGFGLLTGQTGAQESDAVQDAPRTENRPGSDNTQSQDGKLETSKPSPNRITGSYAPAGAAESTISFSGQDNQSPGGVGSNRESSEGGNGWTTVRIEINGLQFTSALNEKTQAYKFDGPNGTLIKKDIREVREAANALGRSLNYDERSGKLPMEDELLMTMFSYLSEAPANYKIPDSAGKLQISEYDSGSEDSSEGNFVKEREPSQGETNSLVSEAHYSAQYTQQCQAKALRSGDFSTLDACAKPDNEGVKVFGCRTKQRSQSHDAKNDVNPPAAAHCFLTFDVKSGPCSNRCAGQCGANCNSMTATKTYTKDCLDHDICSYNHDASGGASDPSCGDEFTDAGDDFMAAAMIRKCKNCG